MHLYQITWKCIVFTVTHTQCFISTAGPQLEKLMDQLRADMTSNPPLAGSYTPKKGDLCAAKFTDGEWQVESGYLDSSVEQFDKAAVIFCANEHRTGIVGLYMSLCKGETCYITLY